MPEATYTEMLLRWKILLYLLEQKLADPGKVKPRPSPEVTEERRKESWHD